MKATGIIVEYNPLHKGHAYHIEQTRLLTGADYVVAVMSGSFVQRGAPALLAEICAPAWLFMRRRYRFGAARFIRRRKCRGLCRRKHFPPE